MLNIVCLHNLLCGFYGSASMLYHDGKINEIEYKVYMNWFDHFIQDLPEISLIYVHTEPETCLRRIRKRNRQGEESIQLDYLSSCHEFHDKMIKEMTRKNVRVLTLDGNEDKKSDNGETGDLEYFHWTKDIRDFIHLYNELMETKQMAH